MDSVNPVYHTMGASAHGAHGRDAHATVHLMGTRWTGTILAMLTLINTNRMVPAIGPIGLEYVAETAARAGIEVDVLDLALSEDPEKALREHLLQRSSTLIGLTFRNVDDCFWPSAQWFVPELAELVQRIRRLSEAPIVVGGVGFSIFAEQIVDYVGADFGIHGDGEQATISLYRQLEQDRPQFEEVPGLVWRDEKRIRSNPPAWPAEISLPVRRTMVDNRAYFARGGQCGFVRSNFFRRQALPIFELRRNPLALELPDIVQVDTPGNAIQRQARCNYR